MPDVWLPGAFRDPGVNAGYNAGTNRLQLAVAHFTVGADSRQVGRNGYFHWLVHRDASRENGCTQYAPVAAATWHAGGSSSMPDANQRGPGIEFERMVTGGYNAEGLANAEPLTPNQIEWGARIVAFLAGWGVPAAMYDGPRFGADGWSGWVNHHDLDKDRYDGLTNAEWGSLAAPVTPPPVKGDPMKMVQYGDTWIQFGVDTAGDLIQSTYDANLVLIRGAQDVPILDDNRPSCDVTVDVLADKRILVGSEDRNGKNRAIHYLPGDGWYDATGRKLP